MPLGTLWVGSVAIFALCGTGVALCREIMLEEVQRRLPEGQKIKYPYLSTAFHKYDDVLSGFGRPNSVGSAFRRLFRYAERKPFLDSSL